MLGWINRPRHNTLYRQNDLCTDDKRIDMLMWLRRVPTPPHDRQTKIVLAGHNTAWLHRQLPCRAPGHIVHAINSVHGKSIEQTIINHGLRAEPVLLVWLKDKINGTVEIQ